MEPWGEERADFRMGILASIFANIHRRRSQRAFRPQDFMPRYGVPRPERQTPEEQLRTVEMLNLAFGGRDLRKR